MAVLNVRDAVTEASLIIGQRSVACCVGLRARYDVCNNDKHDIYNNSNNSNTNNNSDSNNNHCYRHNIIFSKYDNFIFHFFQSWTALTIIIFDIFNICDIFVDPTSLEDSYKRKIVKEILDKAYRIMRNTRLFSDSLPDLKR